MKVSDKEYAVILAARLIVARYGLVEDDPISAEVFLGMASFVQYLPNWETWDGRDVTVERLTKILEEKELL